MYKIIYISSASKPFSPAEIDDLLSTSRENNSRLGITGMLIHREGNFIQLLEGEEAAVKGLYAKIQHDPRHHDSFILDEGEVAGRSLADWSMKFQHFDGHPIFTTDAIAADATGNLEMLSDFVMNMR